MVQNVPRSIRQVREFIRRLGKDEVTRMLRVPANVDLGIDRRRIRPSREVCRHSRTASSGPRQKNIHKGSAPIEDARGVVGHLHTVVIIRLPTHRVLIGRVVEEGGRDWADIVRFEVLAEDHRRRRADVLGVVRPRGPDGDIESKRQATRDEHSTDDWVHGTPPSIYRLFVYAV